jgi:hypothetical protein
MSRRTYSDPERERGLVALAYYSGNAGRASAALKEQGLPIPKRTLNDWRNRHAEVYERVRQEMLPRIEAEVAEQHTELANAAIDTQRKVLERLRGEVDELPARDLPGAARNVAVTSGIHSEKARLYRDEPTEIRGASADDLETLTRRWQKLIEAHPELIQPEPQDAEVVEPAGLPSGEPDPAT